MHSTHHNRWRSSSFITCAS